MSKGSASRPYSVPRETFADNFDTIFGKKKQLPEIPAQTMGAWGIHDSVTDRRTPEQQAKEELGPYVPRSSPAHGAEEGGDTPEA